MPHSTETLSRAEIINRLLSHYGTSAEPYAVRRAIAEDWMEDLAEFTPTQIARAAREWRRSQSLRPTIAEIRNLATRAQRKDLERNALPAPAIERGLWENDQQRQGAIAAQEERYRRAAAFRQGGLDAYDAVYHPDLLAKRGEAIAKTQHASEAVSKALDDLGVSSSEAAE